MGSKGCWEKAEIDRIDPALMSRAFGQVNWGVKPLHFRCAYCGTTFKSEPKKCEQCGARKFEVTR